MSQVTKMRSGMKKIAIILLIALICQPVTTGVSLVPDTAELHVNGCRAINGYCDLVGAGFTGD